METSVDWREPLFFEDSPSCPKEKYCACNPEGNCVLMSFVPAEHRHETVPCWYIPLNAKGETIQSLHHKQLNRQVEERLRTWLVKNIMELEQQIAHETSPDATTPA
jgi:hypothetical protein